MRQGIADSAGVLERGKSSTSAAPSTGSVGVTGETACVSGVIVLAPVRGDR